MDPFDAQEARPYKQDPEIIAMTNLVDAYQVCGGAGVGIGMRGNANS